MLDEVKIARARLQCALESAFLRVSAHLFAALLLAFGRLGSRLPMKALAHTRFVAAVADALKLHVRVLVGVRHLIVLQPVPKIRVVATFGWRQRRLDWRKEALGFGKKLVGALVRLGVVIENALEGACIICKYKLRRVERVIAVFTGPHREIKRFVAVEIVSERRLVSIKTADLWQI